ncbi:hypothetical protein AQ490_21755 [Wenjunlia vitaminophila]|uniref:OmpR/PhoB-type domain-containing protein n=1 Tax=Wenjunlia vitaminophila TaxID=76728 RepID=A0A0T6LTG1_WENVI|nr:BTAD domain-containing putative transcriptional regulator [Wenjunlia vitaminophila]KRV49122.1 hypothetical protein AQ490_21755 [Wenjunlia vitaminophila]
MRILGPVAVEVDGREVTLGPQQRVLLAALVLARGRPVSRARLIELMWEQEVPDGASTALRTHILNLRRVLEPDRRAQQGYTVLVSTGGRNNAGYALRLAPGQLDAEQFAQLVRQARQDGGGGDPLAALEALDRALGLWQGPALDGLGDRSFAVAESTRLEEQRLAAREDRMDALLALGHYEEVVGELTTLVGEYRLRERLWSQLILALYRSGRQADALSAYRQVYRLLDEELGVAPGRPLQELHRQVLQADPALEATEPRPSVPVPRQLPPDTGGFTGRTAYLRLLDALLRTQKPRPGRPLMIASISGTAGVGKTALAVHWSRRVAERFPDGQLHLSLRAYASSDPLTADEALGQLLRALGVASLRIPRSQDEKASLYRSLLADRRVLLLLDDASSLEQVRPLLPASPTCLVVVTSRHDLRGLSAFHDAQRINLDVLTDEEAVALLARVVGGQRVRAEPEAAEELALVCGRLPLALRICAANLGSGRYRRIADMVRALREGDRLAELNVDGDQQTAVEATFDLFYQGLSDPARRAFRLLGLVPGSDVTPGAAAALAGCQGTRDAARLLDQLESRHMIESYVPGRYHFHDLLRLYARERAFREEGPQECEAALRRLLSWYLTTADNASRALFGAVYNAFALPRQPISECPVEPQEFADLEEAWEWVNAERANVLSCIDSAADNGPHAFAWQMTDALHGHFMGSGHLDDWLRAAHAGLRAAVASGSELGQAVMHETLGNAYLDLADFPRSVQHSTEAVELCEGTGATILGSMARLVLAIARWNQADLDAATEQCRRTLETFQALEQPAGEAFALTMLGFVAADQGRLNEALGYLTQAEAMTPLHESVLTVTTMLRTLGYIQRHLGRLADARRYLSQALVLYRQSQVALYEESALCNLALILCDAGYYRLALSHAERALSVIHRTNRRLIESDLHNVLGIVLGALGDVHEALDHHRRALELASKCGCRRSEASAHIGVSARLRGFGRLNEALSHARSAVEVAQRYGLRLVEGEALDEVARAHAALGGLEVAVDWAQQSLAVHRETGFRLGAARALETLGNTHGSLGNVPVARGYWQEALGIYESLGVPDARRLRAALAAHEAHGVQS